MYLGFKIKSYFFKAIRKLLLLQLCLFYSLLEIFATNIKISENNLEFFDKQRNRIVPVYSYFNSDMLDQNCPVAIISHGYSVKNTEYGFLAKRLSGEGYCVFSIQHDLENDPTIPKTGDLFQRRKPLWQRGVKNILFVISELKKQQANLNLRKVLLIGHSNGGDISMLFTALHPELVSKVISLDSLRYPFPTKDHIPILSLRANDTKADKGVLPKSGVTIVKLGDAKHIDMCDRGPEKVKKEIGNLLREFLNNPKLKRELLNR